MPPEVCTLANAPLKSPISRGTRVAPVDAVKFAFHIHYVNVTGRPERIFRSRTSSAIVLGIVPGDLFFFRFGRAVRLAATEVILKAYPFSLRLHKLAERAAKVARLIERRYSRRRREYSLPANLSLDGERE